MSEYFEIAYAALSGRLCLFTGTGFSKAVSDNEAPTWQGLLESLCVNCEEPDEIKASLFPDSGKNALSLEEAAQVLEIELLKNGKKIHEEIANIISTIELSDNIDAIKKFCLKHRLKVITTNYDKLMEKLCGRADCQSLTPGLPIPRSSARVKVYHVHGSIDVSDNMVVTADDYFRFLNSETYFSRNLSTVLHENTVVIL
jgi:SIR2-like domain